MASPNVGGAWISNDDMYRELRATHDAVQTAVAELRAVRDDLSGTGGLEARVSALEGRSTAMENKIAGLLGPVGGTVGGVAGVGALIWQLLGR